VAKAEIKMPDDFLERVSKLADKTDEIVPRVLEAGGKVMLDRTKSNLQAVIGKTKYPSRTTGKLVGALGVSSTRMDRNGNYNVKVGFAEPRSDGESNAKIANIIEHGKHDQPAHPFLKPAKSAAKDACVTAMKSKLEEEIDKI